MIRVNGGGIYKNIVNKDYSNHIYNHIIYMILDFGSLPNRSNCLLSRTLTL